MDILLCFAAMLVVSAWQQSKTDEEIAGPETPVALQLIRRRSHRHRHIRWAGLCERRPISFGPLPRPRAHRQHGRGR